jgi:hypothetical protein
MNGNRTLWIILLVFLLVLSCCCVATAAIAGSLITRSLDWRSPQWDGIEALGVGTEVTDELARSASIEGPVNLVVDVPVGNIVVRAGAGDRVTLQATKRAWGWSQAQARTALADISIGFEQTGDQVRVKADGLTAVSNLPRSPQVDMVISVPEETAVRLATNVGQTRVVGTRGDVNVKSDVGEVVLQDVVPAESLQVETRVATIDLTGPVVDHATYRLTSDVGRIALRLPPASSFSIDARSDIGGLQLEFPLAGDRFRQGFLGEAARGDVGPNPTAELYLRSRVGGISVRPGE